MTAGTATAGPATRRGVAVCAGVGVVFGFLLTGSGLGNYRTIHDGLLLRDPYIYLMLASSVGVAAVGVWLLQRHGRTALGGPRTLPRHRPRRGTVAGSAVFGVGFAVGATCPGITVAMIATGNAWGAVVLVGIFVGLWLRGRHEAGPAGQGRARASLESPA